MREASAFTPTASPRLRRRPSPWPPHRTSHPASELISTGRTGPDHALHTGPYPSGLSRHWTYGASDSGSSRTPSHHCLPDPGRLTVPTRPVRCRSCSHRRVRSHVPAAPRFTGQLRLTSGGVLSPPLDSRRLVAHGRPPVHPLGGCRQRPLLPARAECPHAARVPMSPTAASSGSSLFHSFGGRSRVITCKRPRRDSPTQPA